MSGDPSTFLPLTHLSYHILLALSEEALHGYAIVKSVRKQSEGTINPGTGTFYSAIKRMMEERLLIEARPPTRAAAADSRRRYYRMTDLGLAVLAEETARLQRLVASAGAVRAPAGGE